MKRNLNTPKIKEYIEQSGYSSRTAAVRLGRSQTYIQDMVKGLGDINKEEIGIIKLWRETKGEKGMAPSNLIEVKKQHPEKLQEILEIAKEEVVSRSDILQEVAKK
jgi:hypothetical protein